jgi:hypothetical protein
MAGILFLKSFRNDDLLSALVQNIYDMMPFTFEKLATCMNIEHSQSESSAAGSVNAVGPKSTLMRPNKEKSKAIPTSQHFQNVIPTRGCLHQVSKSSSPSLSNMSKTKIQQLLEQQIQMLKKLQVNTIDKEDCCDEEIDKDVDAVNEYHPDNTVFFVNIKDSMQVVSHDVSGTRLILNTDASKSKFSDSNLLHDMKPVTKHIQTYSGAIDITHIGTMKFGIYNVFPVYYSLSGKCNLGLVSQLEDHGFCVYHKNKMFLVYMGTRLVKQFPCVGNLYVSTLSGLPVVNSLFLIS